MQKAISIFPFVLQTNQLNDSIIPYLVTKIAPIIISNTPDICFRVTFSFKQTTEITIVQIYVIDVSGNTME